MKREVRVCDRCEQPLRAHDGIIIKQSSAAMPSLVVDLDFCAEDCVARHYAARTGRN